MDSLDNPISNYPPESSVSMMPTVTRYGLVGGLVLIAFTLVINVSGMNVFSIGMGIFVGLLSFVIYTLIMVMAVKKHRDTDLLTYISFGRAFGVAFLSSAIAGIISSAGNWLYGLVDPGYFDRMRDGATEMYESMGMSEDQIEMAMEQIKNPYSISNIAMGLGVGLLMGAVISLVIAAIMKKERPAST